MRIVSMLVGAILVALTQAAPAQEDAALRDAVALFKRNAYMSADQLEKCSQAYMNALAVSGNSEESTFDIKRIHAEKNMHAIGCLDKWSTLIPQSGGGTQYTSARVSIIENRLYIWFDNFTAAEEAIRRSLSKLPQKLLGEVTRVVVDLRDNEGGSVDELADVLERLFSPKPLQEYMQIDAIDYPASHRTSVVGKFAGLPIDILTSKVTASASEWMIAELKKWYPDTTRVIGKKTLGKNIVQCYRHSDRIKQLSIRVTCGKWKYLGKDIYEIGIEPDIDVELSKCSRDDLCLSKTLTSLN